MVSNELTELEYQIFNQVNSQVVKRTNSLFQVANQLVSAFIKCYLPYTKLDANAMDRNTRRKTERTMKSRIQNISKTMQHSDLPSDSKLIK